ncbi:MAG: DUF1492 domain-containing protein [Clostridia bacterium]|nr:DUF1492 domain-containing protein [Clostridia bacterium]
MDLNETYDFLMQIRRKEIIIRRKEMQRDELRACLLPGAVRYDRDKVQSTPTDKMSDVMARVDELDREIEQLKLEKAQAIIEISDVIEKLDNDKEKAVLTAFYIKAASMETVAGIVCYSVRHTYLLRKQGVEHLKEVLSA